MLLYVVPGGGAAGGMVKELIVSPCAAVPTKSHAFNIGRAGGYLHATVVDR